MIWKLLGAYVQQGWFFLLCHVGLLTAFAIQLRKFSREATALQSWYSGGAGTTQCTKALNDFVKETEKWAAQGSLVPLTDFTDRLDSVVEGMIGRLHDLVNLFLVVGIAGTVYGMFYFVVRAPSVQDPTHLAPLLSEALGKALPVAFVGLILYVAGYIVASQPEQILRNALGEATQRALSTRKVPATKTLTATLQEALQPLKDLRLTLTGVVQPVIEQWGQHLVGTYKLVDTQLEALKTAVNSVGGAVDGVNVSVHELKSVAQDLKKAVQTARPVLEKMDALYEAQCKRLEELSETIAQARQASVEGLQEIRAANELVIETMNKFEALPGQTREIVERQMLALSDQLPGIWQKAADQLRQDVVNIVERVEKPMNTATEKVGQAAQKWEESAANARQIFEGAFEAALGRVQTVARQELRNMEEVFVNRFPTVVGQMRETATQWQDLSNRVTTLNQELMALLDKVRATQVPTEILAKLDTISVGVRKCADEIGRTLRVLDDGSPKAITALLGSLNQQMTLLARRKVPKGVWAYFTAPIEFDGWRPRVHYPD